jgi:AraC-like DNA-binding protein
MILTSLPDLPPRPETVANAAFRRRFYERWGRENAVVCGRSAAAEYARHVQTLSIKMAWGGGERYLLPHRDVLVDDDSYLVLGEGMQYGSVLCAPRPVQSFAVFFRPGMPGEVAHARQQDLAQALDSGGAAPAGCPAFAPHLRRHDERVTPRLRRLWQAVQQGPRDEDWLEARLLDLLDALLAAEGQHAAVPNAAGQAPRRAARLELQRRLHLAADFIDSNAGLAIDLQAMAEAACLSRYHFVREFGRHFGLTPHAWLTRKRATLARRLMAQGETDAERIAQASGLGSRWALRRALARWPDGR